MTDSRRRPEAPDEGLGILRFCVAKPGTSAEDSPVKGPGFPVFLAVPRHILGPKGGCVLNKRVVWLLYIGALGLSMVLFRINATAGGILLAAGLVHLMTAGKT